ncbi:hypothetical protein [Nocardia amamiensis]|uniref:hypothetical protein n=1 Tax=Nocardia TaxID=1817 RepID=UPI0033FE54D6
MSQFPDAAAGLPLRPDRFGQRFADGGEVESRQDYDDGTLALRKPGIIGRFLNWQTFAHKAGQVTGNAIFNSASGELGTDPAQFAITGAAGVQTVLQTATTALAGAGQDVLASLRRSAPLPMAAQPRIRTLQGTLGGGVQIDRTMTINVLQASGGDTPPSPAQPFHERAATYLAHRR